MNKMGQLSRGGQRVEEDQVPGGDRKRGGRSLRARWAGPVGTVGGACGYGGRSRRCGEWHLSPQGVILVPTFFSLAAMAAGAGGGRGLATEPPARVVLAGMRSGRKQAAVWGPHSPRSWRGGRGLMTPPAEGRSRAAAGGQAPASWSLRPRLSCRGAVVAGGSLAST